jgi:hypothetical protein
MNISPSLSPRQKRILREVFSELENAISISDARTMLEAQNEVRIQLANANLDPIAFSLRHGTWRTWASGILAEILAWTTLFVIVIFRVLLSLPFAVFTGYSGFIGIALSNYRKRWRSLKRSRWTARRRRYNAYRKLRVDEREPYLYLRTFSSDHLEIEAGDDGRTFTERLAEKFETLGPVIAVAGPGEENPMLGPVRLYFNDNLWRAGVVYLISISRLVIIQAGISQGTLWELGVARANLEPEQLIISISDPSDSLPDLRNYMWFKPYAEEILGTELPLNIVFGDSLIKFRRNWESYF